MIKSNLKEEVVSYSEIIPKIIESKHKYFSKNDINYLVTLQQYITSLEEILKE